MNEKNGDDIEGGNMEWSEKDEVDYWKFLKKKTLVPGNGNSVKQGIKRRRNYVT